MNSQPLTQHIELWPINRLVQYPRNPRKNDAAVDRMCACTLGIAQVPVGLCDATTQLAVVYAEVHKSPNHQCQSGRASRQKRSSSTMRSTVNADNRDLQPLYAGGLIIGSVDTVNGPSGREVPGYKPTRAELLELVKYWASTFLDTAYFVFATGQIGSTEIRLGPYAERRVDRIIELLGDDAVEAVREVRNQFAKRIGYRRWKEFYRYLGPNHLHGATGEPSNPRRKHAVH